MNDTKGIAVVVLSVMCVVLFVAFISSAVGLQKQKNLLQAEIAKRMNIEEQLQKVSVDNNSLKQAVAQVKQEADKIKVDAQEAIKSSDQGKMTVQALQNELEKEKLLNQKLQSDLKEALAKR